MRKRTGRTAVLLRASFVFVILLVSFATAQEKSSSEESLRSVAERYWNLRMGGKFEETYKVEDKEGLPPFETYRGEAGKIRGLDIASYRVKDASEAGGKGLVIVEFLLRFQGPPKPIPEDMRDQWVYKEGRWLHVFPK